jgi:alkylation response protein AidB-like acyl-CoA dehydrogenase
VTATPTADGYRIDGVKDRVEAGAESALLLVVARGEDGPRQFLLPTDAPGLTVTPQRSLDLVKRYARADFDAVTVEASAAVGSAAQTPALIDRQAQIAVVLQCAEAVGILDTVLGMTIRWALDRHSFGRPLASYQALKHRLADMKMWLEACRGITYGAVADVAARNPDAPLTVSAAKSYLGEHATTIAHECVQLHGGIGVTWEHDLHLFLRRITLYRSMFGTPAEHHRAIYARLQNARSAA